MNLEQKFCQFTIKDLSKKIESLEILPTELIECYLTRIKKLD